MGVFELFIERTARVHDDEKMMADFHKTLANEDFPYYYCWWCGRSTGRKQAENRESRRSKK